MNRTTINGWEPQHTLEFASDGDGSELIAAVGAAFGASLSAAEIASCHTAGDLFAILIRAAPPQSRPGKCAAALAFYRVRRVLLAQAPRDELVAAAKLADVVTQPPYRFHAELEKQSGLSVPGFHFSKVGNTGLLAAMLGPAAMVGAAIIGYPAWPGALAFMAGVAMMFGDPRQLPDTTLGEFADELASLNLGVLARGGASTTERSLWEAYVQVLRSETGIRDSAITPETRLLA